jgi:hypothetical protein
MNLTNPHLKQPGMFGQNRRVGFHQFSEGDRRIFRW